MKMKLLDYTLIGILAGGLAATASAQDAQPATAGHTCRSIAPTSTMS